MIPGDLLSAFPHRQFHTLTGLLDSRAALPNSNPNACMPMQGGSLYHFYDGLWYDPAERWTHDLPCERRTRYRLSQPDTVIYIYSREANSRPTMREADTLLTEPTRHGHIYIYIYIYIAERRTHDLPCEKRTRYRLSQPDTVIYIYSREANSRPTVREADTLPTEPTRHGHIYI